MEKQTPEIVNRAIAELRQAISNTNFLLRWYKEQLKMISDDPSTEDTLLLCELVAKHLVENMKPKERHVSLLVDTKVERGSF